MKPEWRTGTTQHTKQRLPVVLLFFMSLIFMSLQYRLWFGEGSWSQLQDVQEQIEKERQTNSKLILRNQNLTQEVIGLQNGDVLLEEYAREEMGMIRPGETFYLTP